MLHSMERETEREREIERERERASAQASPVLMFLPSTLNPKNPKP